MTLFDIETLTYDVPGRRLLDGLTLTLPKGRMIGLGFWQNPLILTPARRNSRSSSCRPSSDVNSKSDLPFPATRVWSGNRPC